MKYLRLLIHIPPLLLLGCFAAFVLWLNTGSHALWFENAYRMMHMILKPFRPILSPFGLVEGENGEFLSGGGSILAILSYVFVYYLIIWCLLRLTVDRKKT